MQKQVVVILALQMIGGRAFAEQEQIQEEYPTSKQPYFQAIWIKDIGITVVSRASAHSQVSTHITISAVWMESTHSQASAHAGIALAKIMRPTYEDDGDVDNHHLDPFSDSDELQLHLTFRLNCT